MITELRHADCPISSVARDRGWFSTYTPFQTFVTDLFGNRIEALGVGDVRLPVKLFPKRSGSSAHGTMHLRTVLHVLISVCKILGSPEHDEYAGMRLSGVGDDGKDGELIAEDGRRVGYLVKRRFFVLKLSGPPVGPVVGPSPLDLSVQSFFHAFWPDSERRRCECGTNRLLGFGWPDGC